MKARPSEIVIGHATKVAWKLLRGKKKDAESKEQKEAIANANERETRQMRGKKKERRILLLRNWRVLIMRNGTHWNEGKTMDRTKVRLA